MSALAGGETQFHVGSATGTSIGAMAGGLDLAFIAGLINKLDGAFVVNSSIRSPADLKGKRIGIQSIGGGVWMFTMLAFDHWGLDPDRDKIQFRILGDQSVQAQAIAQNVIDGGYLSYSYGAQLERQGYRIMADLIKMGIPVSGPGRHGEAQLIDKTPELPERALRALVETITFVNNPANKNVVVKSLMKELRLTKVEDAQAGYEMMRVLFEKRIYPMLTVCATSFASSVAPASRSASSKSRTLSTTGWCGSWKRRALLGRLLKKTHMPNALSIVEGCTRSIARQRTRVRLQPALSAVKDRFSRASPLDLSEQPGRGFC